MRALAILAVLVLLAAPALAQTTGVVGDNDLTLNGIGSGSTSGAANQFTACTPSTLTFEVSTLPGSAVFLFASPAPVAPGSLALGCTTVDLMTTPLPLVFASGTTDLAGLHATGPIPLPLLLGVQLSVQGIVVAGPCLSGPHATQAYALALSSGPVDCPE